MKWIFEVEVQASRNKDKILHRIMQKMMKAAESDKQTKMVSVKKIKEEDE